MAGHPIHRKQFATDCALLALATEVPLYPKKDRAVFYADDFGARLAAAFIKNNREFTRLDELLSQTQMGRNLWSRLTLDRAPWNKIEEVWWELS